MDRESLKSKVEEYIESKDGDWAISTQGSEKRRLMALLPVLNGDPERLLTYLDNRETAPYTRLTTFIRVGEFWKFLLTSEGKEGANAGNNAYIKYRKEHRRLFRHSYTRRKCPLTMEEAKERISKVGDLEVRSLATILLFTGMRYCEWASLQDGMVIGKGGARREVFIPEGYETFKYTKSYRLFHQVLRKEAKLKPHDLRKIFLTELVNLGANTFELQTAAGWRSLGPAQSYINVQREKLKKLFLQAQRNQP